MTAEGRRVEHVGSILMPVDQVVFSLIAAGDESLVRQLNERADLPADRIARAIALPGGGVMPGDRDGGASGAMSGRCPDQIERPEPSIRRRTDMTHLADPVPASPRCTAILVLSAREASRPARHRRAPKRRSPSIAVGAAVHRTGDASDGVPNRRRRLPAPPDRAASFSEATAVPTSIDPVPADHQPGGRPARRGARSGPARSRRPRATRASAPMARRRRTCSWSRSRSRPTRRRPRQTRRPPRPHVKSKADRAAGRRAGGDATAELRARRRRGPDAAAP